MKKMNVLLAGAVIGALGYAAILRPRSMRWGATWRERSRIWAGDEFMPEPVTRSVRVITIHAPAEHVWPWVAQIGQDRGGFYSYTPLENLVGAEMKNAEEIHPEWQHRNIGDKVWLGAPSKFDGKACMIVARWVAGRNMVLVAPPDWERITAGGTAENMVWSFIVEPISRKSCRLIARGLGGRDHTTAGRLANYMFWEPAHFIMERGMMLGIQRRAEAREEQMFPIRIIETAAAFADSAKKLRELTRTEP